MRVPRVRFTILRLMTVVAISALVVTPFAWTPPGSRRAFLLAVLTVGFLALILASPFLLDRLEGSRSLGPRRATARSPGPGRTSDRVGHGSKRDQARPG